MLCASAVLGEIFLINKIETSFFKQLNSFFYNFEDYDEQKAYLSQNELFMGWLWADVLKAVCLAANSSHANSVSHISWKITNSLNFTKPGNDLGKIFPVKIPLEQKSLWINIMPVEKKYRCIILISNIG